MDDYIKELKRQEQKQAALDRWTSLLFFICFFLSMIAGYPIWVHAIFLVGGVTFEVKRL